MAAVKSSKGASTAQSDSQKQLAAALAVIAAAGAEGKAALQTAGLVPETRSAEKGTVHEISYQNGKMTLEVDLTEAGKGRWKIATDKASDRNKGTKRMLFCDTYARVELPDGSEGSLVVSLTGDRVQV